MAQPLMPRLVRPTSPAARKCTACAREVGAEAMIAAGVNAAPNGAPGAQARAGGGRESTRGQGGANRRQVVGCASVIGHGPRTAADRPLLSKVPRSSGAAVGHARARDGESSPRGPNSPSVAELRRGHKEASGHWPAVGAGGGCHNSAPRTWFQRSIALTFAVGTCLFLLLALRPGYGTFFVMSTLAFLTAAIIWSSGEPPRRGPRVRPVRHLAVLTAPFGLARGYRICTVR